MIIVRVPFRVSLFGGGTDFPEFFREKSATVVSMCIDKYCYISLRRLLPYFNTKYRVCWSFIEEVNSIGEISHPSVKACLSYMGIDTGLEIHTVGDLPARSGLGSSSAFTAALLGALHYYQDRPVGSVDIVEKTIEVEQKILGECVGIQDQIQVCHGGFNVTKIFPDSSYSIVSLGPTSRIVREIDESLVLVYSGITRTSSVVQGISKTVPSAKGLVHQSALNQINRIAESFASGALSHSVTYDDFIELLNEAWSYKVSTFEPSKTTALLLSIYEKAITCGARSGKLLGAGGGGFFAFFVPKEQQDSFITAMSPYVALPASISFKGLERIL